MRKVPLLVKTAEHKFDHVLHILSFSATRYLVKFFEGQTLTVCHG